MTYLEAALEVLRASRRPLSTNEIVETARSKGLLQPRGRTPGSTMSATLYEALGGDYGLVKTAEPGPTRARRGSVRWSLEPRRARHGRKRQ